MVDKHFQFADFVDEFRVDFVAFDKVDGHYNNEGKWIDGAETTRSMGGIILPLSNDDLKHEVNGTYTVKDRKVYTTESLSIGQRLEYKTQSYSIDREKPYSDYADVYIYFAKGVE